MQLTLWSQNENFHVHFLINKWNGRLHSTAQHRSNIRIRKHSHVHSDSSHTDGLTLRGISVALSPLKSQILNQPLEIEGHK